MSLDPRDSENLRLLTVAAARIANALEAGIPPIIPPNVGKEDTESIKMPMREDGLKEKEDKEKESAYPRKSPNYGTDFMHWKGNQMFYDRPCDAACPKARSCVEYAPGQECIGWKTPSRAKIGGK